MCTTKDYTRSLNGYKTKGSPSTKTRLCKFHLSRIDYLGHIIESEGISPDPKRTDAIRKMPPPACLTELRSFMAIVNRLKNSLTKLQNCLSHCANSSAQNNTTHGHRARMMPSKAPGRNFRKSSIGLVRLRKAY